MTPAQEKFLRELAEKLGWEECVWLDEPRSEDGNWTKYSEWLHPEDSDRGMYKARRQDWLLTNDGMMYLIQRALKLGYYERAISYGERYVNVMFWHEDEPHKKEAIGVWDDAEPWAIAQALGEMLGVKMESGLPTKDRVIYEIDGDWK